MYLQIYSRFILFDWQHVPFVFSATAAHLHYSRINACIVTVWFWNSKKSLCWLNIGKSNASMNKQMTFRIHPSRVSNTIHLWSKPVVSHRYMQGALSCQYVWPSLIPGAPCLQTFSLYKGISPHYCQCFSMSLCHMRLWEHLATLR